MTDNMGIRQVVTVNLKKGDAFFSTNDVRNLIKDINDSLNDGAKIVLPKTLWQRIKSFFSEILK